MVFEVLNDLGERKGWCPLGGGIDFGETAEDALKREFFEELGCEIAISGKPFVIENLFEHHGVKGHEIILAFFITFNNPNIYSKKRFQIYQDLGSIHWAEWIDIEVFLSGKEVLFPPNLLKKIEF